MRAIKILSATSFCFTLVGCAYTDNQDMKSDLLYFGMICLFTLMYSSHLVGMQNQINNEQKKNNN